MTAAQRTLAEIAVALAVLSATYLGWRAHERALGARDATIGQLQRTTAALAVKLQADSALLAHHDTVRVFQQVVHADTVLQRLIDSAIVHHTDTLVVTREVLVEAKATIDSTKRVADACCQLARDWKARWFSTDSLYRLVLAKVPSAATPWVDRAEGALVCGGAVWLAGKLAKP